MLLYIFRHGETDLNRQGIVQGSGMDTELNAKGRAQAKAFYERYKAVGFDLVVTSQLKRTQQTAAPFLEQGLPWQARADLNEISWGEHEGHAPTPLHLARYHTMIEHWKNGQLDASLPGGESARQLLERVHRFVEWVCQRPEQTILVATHGRTLRCLITVLKGWSPAAMEEVPHANTGLYVARYEGGAFDFLVENDTSHLLQTHVDA